MFNLIVDDQDPNLNPEVEEDDSSNDSSNYDGEVVIESCEGHFDSD